MFLDDMDTPTPGSQPSDDGMMGNGDNTEEKEEKPGMDEGDDEAGQM